MRIVLIRHHAGRSNASGRYPHAANLYPPLGLVCIASALKAEMKEVVIQILDSWAMNLTLAETIDEVNRFQPDLIGITAFTETLPGAVEIGEACAKNFPDTLRIIGGPNMSVEPEAVMRLGIFHCGIIGEGEVTFGELVSRYNTEKRIPLDINGTCHFSGGNFTVNAPRPRIGDLDVLPIPDRSLIDNSLYGPFLGLRPFTYMVTTRGCPFNCAFCYGAVWGKKVTQRSAGRIFEEMHDAVHRFGIREIWFKDDTFTARRSTVLALCRRICEEGLKVHWSIFARVDTVDEEVIIALRKAGCYKIDFGVESGDQAMLDLMEKGITIEQTRMAFSLCRQHGMETHAFIMIGYPRDTLETIEKTIRFACEIADWASFSAVSVLRGTRLYDLAISEGYFTPRPLNSLLGESEMENYVGSPSLPTSTILKLTHHAYQRFFMRPLHVLRLMKLMLLNGSIGRFIIILPYVLFRIFGRYIQVPR